MPEFFFWILFRFGPKFTETVKDFDLNVRICQCLIKGPLKGGRDCGTHMVTGSGNSGALAIYLKLYILHSFPVAQI
jgi:hypothetical protein